MTLKPLKLTKLAFGVVGAALFVADLAVTQFGGWFTPKWWAWQAAFFVAGVALLVARRLAILWLVNRRRRLSSAGA